MSVAAAILSPKVRAFVEFMAGHIGDEPRWDLDARAAERSANGP